VFAAESVNQTASGPTAIPPGPALGSTRLTTFAVRGSSRESSPEEGATHTPRPRTATDPGWPGKTLPIRVVWETLSNWGLMRRTATEEAVGLGPTTHTAPGDAASPVGVSCTGRLRVTLRVAGSMRVTVWSSRFATQSESEPEAIDSGRVPTGTWAITLFESG